MFNSNHSGSQRYNQVPPYSDSDSDDSRGEDDFIQREIRNQQVRVRYEVVCVAMYEYCNSIIAIVYNIQ